jgi:hypothetical protein
MITSVENYLMLRENYQSPGQMARRKDSPNRLSTTSNWLDVPSKENEYALDGHRQEFCRTDIWEDEQRTST